jgi:hypothetical protein
MKGIIRKYILNLLLCLFFCNVVLSQQSYTINGKLVDKINSNAILYANVSINNRSIGTITNSEGVFSLSFVGTEQDTICFSHLNYYKKCISLNELIAENVQVQLNRKEFNLNEISVKANSISEIIEKTINNSKVKINDNFPLFFETYYREFVKENDKYTKFADGMLDYYITKNSKKIKTTVRVNQSRAKVIQTESEEGMDWNTTSPLDVRKISLFRIMDKLKNLHSKENATSYKYKLFSNISDDGTEVLLIKFEPKPKINKPLYTGKIEIDKKQNLILSFGYELLPNYAEYSKDINLLIFKAKLLSSEVNVLFHLDRSNYNLSYTRKQFEMKIWNKKKINDRFFFLSDLLVTKTHNKTFSCPITKKEAYKKKALFLLGNNYKSNFWENQNVIKLTPEEEEVVERLK